MCERTERSILFAVVRAFLLVEHSTIVGTADTRYDLEEPILHPPGERVLSNQNGVNKTSLSLDDSWQCLLQNKQVGNKTIRLLEATEGTDLVTMVCRSQAHRFAAGQAAGFDQCLQARRHGVVGATPSVDYRAEKSRSFRSVSERKSRKIGSDKWDSPPGEPDVGTAGQNRAMETCRAKNAMVRVL
jgi:hypothetical protein